MMMHVKRHSDDFACGRWVHIDDGLNHKYAGFNGEILEIKGTSITVQIYDLGLDEDNSISLVPLRFTFPKRNLTLLPDIVFRNLKMQKNAALRYTALFIFMQFGQRFLMSLTPPFVQYDAL